MCVRYDFDVSEIVCENLVINCASLNTTQEGDCPSAATIAATISATPDSVGASVHDASAGADKTTAAMDDSDSALAAGSDSNSDSALPFRRHRHRQSPVAPTPPAVTPCEVVTEAQLYGVEVRCSVRYRYRQVSWPHIQGEGRASALVGDSGVDLLMHATMAADGVPVTAASDPADCAARITIQAIAISEAGLQGWLVKLLRGVIKSSVSRSLSDQTCATVQPLINANGTALLATAAQGIRRIEALPAPPSGAPSPPPPGLLDLSAAPAVHVARYAVESLLAPGGLWNVNDLVKLLLPQDQWLSPPLDVYHWLLPSSLINVTVQLTALAVGGLETVTVLHVETPSPHRLTASVAFRELRLQLHGHVHIVPGPAVQHSKGPVDLNLTLVTTLTDVAAAVGVTLHVDKAGFSRLALSQVRISVPPRVHTSPPVVCLSLRSSLTRRPLSRGGRLDSCARRPVLRARCASRSCCRSTPLSARWPGGGWRECRKAWTI